MPTSVGNGSRKGASWRERGNQPHERHRAAHGPPKASAPAPRAAGSPCRSGAEPRTGQKGSPGLPCGARLPSAEDAGEPGQTASADPRLRGPGADQREKATHTGKLGVLSTATSNSLVD